ncbi:hypothetical protein BV898_07682 [Hypsibius exemplaris]|uniref:Uncharacterized protein n=1 Tax=Hypsibius exemplaris TaxID=2072580 RepID=A0A1W0WSV8_HYPEX|nr:hypothetical protein BV898_07682 [Hypsibius exemplaris]
MARSGSFSKLRASIVNTSAKIVQKFRGNDPASPTSENSLTSSMKRAISLGMLNKEAAAVGPQQFFFSRGMTSSTENLNQDPS